MLALLIPRWEMWDFEFLHLWEELIDSQSTLERMILLVPVVMIVLAFFAGHIARRPGTRAVLLLLLSGSSVAAAVLYAFEELHRVVPPQLTGMELVLLETLQWLSMLTVGFIPVIAHRVRTGRGEGARKGLVTAVTGGAAMTIGYEILRNDGNLDTSAVWLVLAAAALAYLGLALALARSLSPRRSRWLGMASHVALVLPVAAQTAFTMRWVERMDLPGGLGVAKGLQDGVLVMVTYLAAALAILLAWEAWDEKRAKERVGTFE